MVTPHSHLRKVGKKQYGGIWGKRILKEGGWATGHADYGGMVLLSQQHVAPCVHCFEWGLDTKRLRMVVGFCAGIPVEFT